jgi:hypothetical protein
MTWRVNGNLRSARRSPRAGLLETIPGFLHLQNGGERAAWAVVFHALRCGERRAAFEYARATRELDRCVLRALEAFADGASAYDRAPLREYLAREATLRDADPFKACVLAVLAGGGPLPEPRVVATFEDWAWLRLRLAPPGADIRAEVAAAGPWDEITNPFMAGYVRLVTGDYARAAAAFLFAHVHVDEALHLALAMHVHGLVPHDAILPHLLLYAKAVFPANRAAALKYVACVADRGARIRCLARMIVEVANGHEVFEPAIEGSNLAAPPIVDAVGAVEARDVLAAAAALAAEREENRLAVALMALAGDYPGIVRLEARELVQIVEGFQEAPLLAVIRDDYEGMRASGAEVPLGMVAMMRTLLGIAYASVLIRNRKFSEAVAEIEATDLFPPTRDVLNEYKERIRGAEPPLAEAMPRAIVHALRAYAEVFKELPRDEAVARRQLKEKGDVLILLSAMLRVPQAIQKEALDLDNELQF